MSEGSVAEPRKRFTGPRYAGPESRGRISAFCFDSSRWCHGVPRVPVSAARGPQMIERDTMEERAGGTKRRATPLFLRVQRSQAEK